MRSLPATDNMDSSSTRVGTPIANSQRCCCHWILHGWMHSKLPTSSRTSPSVLSSLIRDTQFCPGKQICKRQETKSHPVRSNGSGKLNSLDEKSAYISKVQGLDARLSRDKVHDALKEFGFLCKPVFFSTTSWGVQTATVWCFEAPTKRVGKLLCGLISCNHNHR